MALAVAVSAAAQTAAPTTRDEARDTRQNIREERKEVQQNIKEERKEAREVVQEQKKDLRQTAQEQRQDVRQAVQDKRQELQQTAREKRDAFKAEVKTKREELQTRVKAEREQLKEKLKTIRDEKKKAAVERIDAEIARLNERMGKHFIAVLDQLGNLLGRVGTRADKAEIRGLDVSAVRTAIAAAVTAIENARTAVSAQAGKTYAVTISTEANLKPDVGKARQALQADLKGVREVIRLAHDAVRTAATTLAQISRVDEPAPAPAATPPAVEPQSAPAQ